MPCRLEAEGRYVLTLRFLDLSLSSNPSGLLCMFILRTWFPVRACLPPARQLKARSRRKRPVVYEPWMMHGSCADRICSEQTLRETTGKVRSGVSQVSAPSDPTSLRPLFIPSYRSIPDRWRTRTSCLFYCGSGSRHPPCRPVAYAALTSGTMSPQFYPFLW